MLNSASVLAAVLDQLVLHCCPSLGCSCVVIVSNGLMCRQVLLIPHPWSVLAVLYKSKAYSCSASCSHPICGTFTVKQQLWPAWGVIQHGAGDVGMAAVA